MSSHTNLNVVAFVIVLVTVAAGAGLHYIFPTYLAPALDRLAPGEVQVIGALAFVVLLTAFLGYALGRHITRRS